MNKTMQVLWSGHVDFVKINFIKRFWGISICGISMFPSTSDLFSFSEICCFILLYDKSKVFIAKLS
jgi:hypothetical protein